MFYINIIHKHSKCDASGLRDYAVV